MLRPSLSAFDAWALIDEGGEIVEGPMDGPLSLYFFKERRRGGYAQLFIWFRQGNKPDELIDRMKSGLYKCGVARSVFFFKDGQIRIC